MKSLEVMTQTTHPRYIYAELRPFGESGTLALTPDGEMFQVDLPPNALHDLLSKCDGTQSLATIAATMEDPDFFLEILTLFAETPAFSTRPPHPNEAAWARFMDATVEPERLKTTNVLMIGDEPLVTAIQALGLLQGFGQVVVTTLAELPTHLDATIADNTILLLFLERLNKTRLLEVDALCEQAQVRWASFHIEQGMGWLGPAIVPGRTANYHDLLVRRLSVAESIQTFEAETSAPVATGDEPVSLLSRSEWTWMVAAFCVEIERWIVGAPCRLVSVEVQANPLTYQLNAYPVLPLPDHELTGDLLISAPRDPSLLVNDRCGVVIRTVSVAHHPSIPSALKTYQSHLARMVWHYPTWHNDTISGGSAFDSEENAYHAAIGEAAERYCANFQPGARPIQATYTELQARGEYAVDPEQLTLFSDKMHAEDGCPFTKFTRDTPVQWVKGYSVTHDRPAWMPMSLMYVDWHTGEWEEESLLNPSYYPGIAAGLSLDHALTSALEELVERDSMMVWWLNHHPLPAVETPPELEAFWEGLAAQGQRAWLIPLPNEFGMPVMAGVVENVQEQWLNIGFACRPDPVQAALKAWTEALTLQEGSRDFDEPHGLLRQGIEWGWVLDVFKPWRKDRRYLDDYRPDFRDVVGLLSQQQVFLDPRAIERVRPWVDVPVGLTFADIPALPERSATLYRRLIEAQGYEIFVYDLTAPEIAYAGMKVVRVLVPGLVPNFPAAFPPLGTGRVQNLPLKLGWRTTPLAETELNFMPLPYA